MSDLVKSFLKYKGFVELRSGTNAPLIPNILADYLYICWYDNLQGKLKQEAKQQCNIMMNSYYRFNSEFFKGFNEDQTGRCVDAMNDFCEYVKNEVSLFRLAIRNRLKGLDREKLEIICSLALCKFISSLARDIWGTLYRKRYGGRGSEPNLDSMYIAARNMFRAYTRDNLPKKFYGIDLANDKDINSAMIRFESKVMEFIGIWK